MNNPGDRRQATDDNSTLALNIEALLFALGRPLSRAELQKMLKASPEALAAAIAQLAGERGGVVLVDDGTTLELRTAPEASEAVERVRKDEYSREVGRAGLEALAAILYGPKAGRDGLTRTEIDFIRGVNSSQTLRTLAMRGLIRKMPNPKDERSFLYQPTTELLSSLGVAHLSDLPDYETVRQKLSELERSFRQSQEEPS